MDKTSFNVKFFDWDYLHLTAQTKETYFKSYDQIKKEPYLKNLSSERFDQNCQNDDVSLNLAIDIIFYFSSTMNPKTLNNE